MGDQMVVTIETIDREQKEKDLEATEEVEEEEVIKKRKEKTHELDSLEKEAGKVSSLHSASKVLSIATVLQLAFQSIGVVYGDIGTSPLYVFSSTFPGPIPSKGDVIGALSLIIYSLTLIPLIKYVFIVLRANDNGDGMVTYFLLLQLRRSLTVDLAGGTFALYSLICRHSKVSAIPNERAEEMELSAYKLRVPNRNLKRAQRIKGALEGSNCSKTALLSMALFGTCLVIGDGILTPCISVISAVDGVRKFDAGMSKDVVAMISVIILILLFSIQRFGTDKVGYTFAPVMLVWLMSIGIIGVFNLFRHDGTVLKACNPIQIISYFNRDPKAAWISLGGVVLCMTGTEAMFADLGHFSVRSIQIAFTGLVYPCLICAYIGQAAYLSNFPHHVADTFYKSIPESVYWPMFVVAIMASIIASQAMISATFAIIKQSTALGCFPRVRIIHTSHKQEGQIYIPEINFLLMLAYVFVTAVFKETTNIGNAYGIAVVGVMLVTSLLLVLIMLMIWQTSLPLVVIFVLTLISFELIFFSSTLYKFTSGGYLPLTFAAVLYFIMYVWNYVQRKRHNFEVEQKVSMQYLNSLGSELGISRVPGLGLLYTELTQGIPAIFPHFLTNLPAIHSVLVFVSVKYLAVNTVPTEERFLLRRVGSKDHHMYRCIARYGYRDRRIGNDEFEHLLMENLKSFIRNESWEAGSFGSEGEEEIKFVEKSRQAGVVYLLGHSEVRAAENSSLLKTMIVNYVYDFLRRNCRQGFVDLQIPNKNLLQVGMNYSV